MAENLELLSRQREAQIQRAAEARELQAEQLHWQMLADEYHQQIRTAADDVGRKKMAADLGKDLSTISNWLSCEAGRGFPPPMALLYLREKVPCLKQWEDAHAIAFIEDDEVIAQLQRDLLPDLGRAHSQKFLDIVRRRRASR